MKSHISVKTPYGNAKPTTDKERKERKDGREGRKGGRKDGIKEERKGGWKEGREEGCLIYYITLTSDVKLLLEMNHRLLILRH
jgi:hypothetical protein